MSGALSLAPIALASAAGLALGLRFEPADRGAALAFAGLAALLAWLAWPGAAAGAGFALWTAALLCLAVAIAWVDLRSRTIPDILVLPLGVLGLAHAATRLDLLLPFAATALAAGAGLWALSRVERNGRPLVGEGDALLAAAMATWIGPAGLVSALALGGIAAVLASFVPEADRNGGVPFAPGFCAAALVVWLQGPLF